MNLSVKACLPIIILVFFIPQLHAQRMADLENDHVTVLFDESLDFAAHEVIRLYPGIKKELESALSWKIDFKPTVVLIRENERFRLMAGHSAYVAYAVSDKMLIVIDYSRMNVQPFTLATTLKHELCHLLFHHHIRDNNLPRWFDEGVAQWASGGIGEIITANGKRLLNRASITKKYIPLGRLKHHFPRDDTALKLAYEQSKSLVEYITGTYGSDSLLDIMNRLKEGEPIDDAILWSLSVSLEELEDNWHEHLRRQIPWLTYLSMNLYQILFFLGAIITLIAFVRYLIKKRRQEDWEDFA